MKLLMKMTSDCRMEPPPPSTVSPPPPPSPSPSFPWRPSFQSQEFQHTWVTQSFELEPSYSQLPTPSPANTASRGQKRFRTARLTPEDHLILLGHVCEHRGEYQKGKTAFWKTISQLFEEDTGITPFFITFYHFYITFLLLYITFYHFWIIYF